MRGQPQNLEVSLLRFLDAQPILCTERSKRLPLSDQVGVKVMAEASACYGLRAVALGITGNSSK